MPAPLRARLTHEHHRAFQIAAVRTSRARCHHTLQRRRRIHVEVAQPVVPLRPRRVYFVSHPDVQREPRSHLPVILEISSRISARGRRGIAVLEIAAVVIGKPEQERCKSVALRGRGPSRRVLLGITAAESVLAIGTAQLGEVQEQLLPRRPHFQRVFAHNLGHIAA